MNHKLITTEPRTYPTTPDTSIIVGDRVRSYDFPGNVDCYVLGTVTAIHCDLYIIAVDARVLGNEARTGNGCTSETICAPVNGHGVGFFGPLRGVVRATKDEYRSIKGL